MKKLFIRYLKGLHKCDQTVFSDIWKVYIIFECDQTVLSDIWKVYIIFECDQTVLSDI